MKRTLDPLPQRQANRAGPWKPAGFRRTTRKPGGRLEPDQCQPEPPSLIWIGLRAEWGARTQGWWQGELSIESLLAYDGNLVTQPPWRKSWEVSRTGA